MTTAGHHPRALVIAGPAGAGKTTLARALAAELEWVFADLDEVTGALTEAALRLARAPASAIDGALGGGLRTARYESLLRLASGNLALGRSVVLCAPFSAERADPARWRAVQARLAGAGAEEVVLVDVEVPAPIRQGRLQARGAARDAAKQPADEPRHSDVPAIAVDGTRPAAEQARQILAMMTATGPRC